MVPYVLFLSAVFGGCETGRNSRSALCKASAFLCFFLQASQDCSCPCFGHSAPWHKGVVAGAQHLQKITAPKRGRGEITARAGMSQAGFSLASLNPGRKEDAKQVIAWMQDMVPGSQLPLKPTSSCLHCNWHLINTTSDMESPL